MLSDNLYKHVLITPAEEGATLYAVSGYATATMAARHLQDLQGQKKNARIHLIVGMTAKDGILESNHRGLCALAEKNNFKCSYVLDNEIPVHTKAYAWFNGQSPLVGFVGSANYTQTAFFKQQKEAMDKSNPTEILDYYKKLEEISCQCSHSDAQGLIREDENVRIVREESEVHSAKFPNVTCSFLDRTGQLPQRSGLNWGQRPEYHRNPNQAYIRVPVEARDFFPKRGAFFTLLTDDGQVMVCVRAQDKGKALETPENNSLLGEYFRRRLGVPLGEPVELQHLRAYGRTDATYYKIDDENYVMDFSVK